MMADSSVAVLKVNELLAEIRLDYSRTEVLEDRLAALRASLIEIPDQEVSAAFAPTFIKDLGVPSDKANFKFRRPEVIEIVGSFPLRTVAKPTANVDLAVRMPKSCFLEKDFLSHRYHAKRALYLAVVRKYLMKCSVVRDVEWTLLHQDARKPTLLVHLDLENVEVQINFMIHIIPILDPNTFNVSKLGPTRNNLRGEVKESTPHYNSSVLEDMYLLDHYLFMKNAISELEALQEAILLAKVWIRQRGLASHPDSLNGFLMSFLMAHLSTDAGGGRFMSNMTGLQMFRICLEMIENGKLLRNGLFWQQNGPSRIHSKVKQILDQSFDVIIYDTFRHHNLAFRLTKNALKEIEHEASQTLVAMKGSKDCGFDHVFMTTVDYVAKFDYHIRISTVNNASSTVPTMPCCLDEDSCRVFERNVESLLCRGLGDRVQLVRVIRRSLQSNWTIDQGIYKSRKLPVFAGIIVSNFETAFRVVDIGPNADNKEEAARFRTFWGEKSELRRFKDGAIAEAAVWECEQWQRHLIIQRIVEHVLYRHLPLSEGDVCVVAGQLDFSIREGKKDPAAVTPKLLEAFDVLSKRLRMLEDLPLKISSVQPLSSAFRHAAAFPPQAHPLADERRGIKITDKLVPACIQPLEVMIQLEGSGKWPSDEVAIGKTKVAFCLQIAESMQRLYGVHCVCSEDSIDLLMHGFCFRQKVLYEKDPSLVKRKLDLSSGSVQKRNHVTISTTESLLSPKEDLLLRSLHSSMLSGLQGIHPAYGSTVRLAKRWIGAHLLSGVLGDEAVELLVAYVFIKPAPFCAPSSRITGFLRFLRLLVNHDWGLNPLIVDVNGDLTSKEIDFIMDQFYAERENRPRKQLKDAVCQGGPAMFIATPYDMESLTWTRLCPSTSGLRRLVTYARSSADLLAHLIRGVETYRWQSLFRTPLHLYDVIVILERTKLPFPDRVVFPAETAAEAIVMCKSSNKEALAWLPCSELKHGAEKVEKLLLVGFDPIQYFLEDLKTNFGKNFNVWFDSIGSEVIGLTWTSPMMEHTKAHINKRKRVENSLAVPDSETLLVEVAEMGEGFVKSIHLMNP